MAESGRCTDSHLKNRQLLYQATHPQDVTVIGWEGAQAPGYSSYASSLCAFANQNYIFYSRFASYYS